MKKAMIWLLAVPTVLLMAMGFAFCWVTPANARLFGEGSHYFFTRMVCWTTIGLCLAICTYLVGWRRWLKAAPFVAIGWVGLVAYAATCPLVNGHWGWISAGRFRINVLEFAPFVVALVAAYLAKLLRYKAITVIALALLAFGGYFGCQIASNRNRLERLGLVPSQERMAVDACQSAHAFFQNQCVGAIRESKWFGPCDINLRSLPESVTTCMPASASVLFGRWYLILLALALGVMGCGVGVAWRMSGTSRCGRMP